MSDCTQDKIDMLLRQVQCLDGVKAIGIACGDNVSPIAGESDIDIFVLTETVPNSENRNTVYDSSTEKYENILMNVCEGGNWGTGDVLLIDGIETMLMYFDVMSTRKYISEILEGKHLDSVNGFYPIGRCSTICNMQVIHDENKVLDSIKQQLKTYPVALMRTMLRYHMERVYDREGFSRAVLRKDVLYYHQVLEHAMDHFLQVLFALNKTYFPSRKRMKQYLDSFALKPEDCYERICEVIRFGSNTEDVVLSVRLWTELVAEIRKLVEEVGN